MFSPLLPNHRALSLLPPNHHTLSLLLPNHHTLSLLPPNHHTLSLMPPSHRTPTPQDRQHWHGRPRRLRAVMAKMMASILSQLCLTPHLMPRPNSWEPPMDLKRCVHVSYIYASLLMFPCAQGSNDDEQHLQNLRLEELVDK
jgi:hypothetical protein